MATFTSDQLYQEINIDPVNTGTKAFVAAGDCVSIANILNSLAGNGAASIFNNAVPASSIIHAITPTDFAALTAAQLAQLTFLFTGGYLDATNTNTQTIFTNFFSAMSSATKTAIVAAAKRTGSRAEVLWGPGTVIQVSDVSLALTVK